MTRRLHTFALTNSSNPRRQRSGNWRRALWAALLALAAAAPAAAADNDVKDLPPQLRPWVDWVLAGESGRDCPRLVGSNAKACVWPYALSLDVDDDGGRFLLKVRNDGEKTRVALPGDDKHWPLDVTADRKARVVEGQALPQLALESGRFEVRGNFKWDRLPERLAIPSEVGLVRLKVRGKERRRFERDGATLWLEKQRADEAQEDRLEVVVHRRIRDGVPLVVTTSISLEVSGAGREEFIGPALLPDFVPLRLNAQLPARVEDDGRIRVQVRPGTHVIELDAYLAAAPKTLNKPQVTNDANWPPREVWVFDAAPNLRSVRVEGQSVDPTQTRLPSAWKSLPAYAVAAGEGLTLVEERRGDSDPAPDRLQLQRTMWLDFDGEGMTIQDQVSGVLRRSRRLEMNPPTVLGRVEAFGADQFITRLDDDTAGRVGVELRAQNIQLSATSRIEGKIDSLPAVSWNHDFSAAQSVLHLPPGWRLITATGVDSLSHSWMKTWTLLELFFLLIVTLGFFRLFGLPWAALALVTLTLLIPEAWAPQWIFAFCLIAEGLCRVIPKGPFQLGARALRAFFLLILVAISIPFIVGQIRTGMYPALESRSHQSQGFAALTFNEDFVDAPAGAAAPMKKSKRPRKIAPVQEQAMLSSDSNIDGLQLSSKLRRVDDNSTYQARLRDFDPKASVQTGPGLPSWSWRSVDLGWSGPVQKTQTIHLVLLSPTAGLALSVVRVVLLLLLLLCLFRLPGRFWPAPLTRKMGEHTALFGIPLIVAPLLLGGVDAPKAHAQEIPSAELLGELKARLTAPPLCAPHCVSVNALSLEVDDDNLEITLEVDVAAAQALALPGIAEQWLPTKVTVDKKPATGLRRDGSRLLLALPKGRQTVRLQGRLPRRESVQIRLHQRPHHATAKVAGWSLNGIHEDGQADLDLQLVRVRQQKAAGERGERDLEAAPLPPLVEVSRSVALNLDWSVETEVIRKSPLGQAIVLEVPLLDGEHVTSEGMRVQDGKVQINLGAGQRSLVWSSSLSVRPKVQLEAPKDVPWTETWSVTASPLWHVQFDGIPPVHDEEESGTSFKPWPGETLAVSVARPNGVEGQTRTVERVAFSFKPGIRATDATMTMALRSSLGGQHAIKLPEESELVEVRVGGRVLPLRQNGRTVSLPLVPGQQNVELKWRQDVGVKTKFTTPNVDVGLPLVNAAVTVDVPSSRWVLFVWGPVLGPAILFWSLLVIVLLCAVTLSRVPFSPLSLVQWMLLGLGLTQVPLVVSAFIAAWLLLLGYRKSKSDLDAIWFDLRQIAICGMTFLSLLLLVFAIQEGLLGAPDMQIRGNGSSSSVLKWFVDKTAGTAPSVLMVSVPMTVYRVLMLVWALWLAWSVVRWLRDGWQAFRLGGFWKTPTPKAPSTPPPTSGGGGSGDDAATSGSAAPSGAPTPAMSGGNLRPQDAPRPGSSSAPKTAKKANRKASRLTRDEGSGPIEMLYDAAGTLPPTATGQVPVVEDPLELPELDDESDVPEPPLSIDEEK